MKTPAGFDCKYFYGNYFRGRQDEECRLIGNAAPPGNWTADLCSSCPVPGILRANACENMVLEGKVEKGFLGFRKRVKVTAFCEKTEQFVKEPEVGCGHCHELSFVVKEED